MNKNIKMSQILIRVFREFFLLCRAKHAKIAKKKYDKTICSLLTKYHPVGFLIVRLTLNGLLSPFMSQIFCSFMVIK